MTMSTGVSTAGGRGVAGRLQVSMTMITKLTYPSNSAPHSGQNSHGSTPRDVSTTRHTR